MLTLKNDKSRAGGTIESHFQKTDRSLDSYSDESWRANHSQMRKIAENAFANYRQSNPQCLENSIKRLYLAIVLQAIDDLKAFPDNKALKAWLLTDGLFILEAYDQPIDLQEWEKFVLAGCPGTFRRGRK
jgi:hypothetical protein